MPQFDTFIFSSSLTHFIIIFFVLLFLNNTNFLPRLSAILKLRTKLINKSLTAAETTIVLHDRVAVFSKNLTDIEKNV